MSSSKLPFLFLIFFAVLCCLYILPSRAFDFEVGNETGWAVPPSKLTNFYNIWASKNRFKVGDTVNFKYAEDSMMVVSKEDYEKCMSSHPLFFSNNGRTEFKLNHSGLFYFISGVAGHCQKGQKMIIKILGHDAAVAPARMPSSASGNQTANSTVPGDHPGVTSGAAHSAAGCVLGMALVQLVVIVLGSYLF